MTQHYFATDLEVGKKYEALVAKQMLAKPDNILVVDLSDEDKFKQLDIDLFLYAPHYTSGKNFRLVEVKADLNKWSDAFLVGFFNEEMETIGTEMKSLADEFWLFRPNYQGGKLYVYDAIALQKHIMKWRHSWTQKRVLTFPAPTQSGEQTTRCFRIPHGKVEKFLIREVSISDWLADVGLSADIDEALKTPIVGKQTLSWFEFGELYPTLHGQWDEWFDQFKQDEDYYEFTEFKNEILQFVGSPLDNTCKILRRKYI